MLLAIPVWVAIGSAIISTRHVAFQPENWSKLELMRKAWFPKKSLHISCAVFHLRLCRLVHSTRTTMPHGSVLSVCREESFSSWRHQTHQSFFWGVPKLRRRS